LLLGSKYLPRSAAGFHGEELLLYEACAKLMPKDKIVPKSSVSRRYASEYWLVGEVEGVGFKINCLGLSLFVRNLMSQCK
jgi:hypothetical protein